MPILTDRVRNVLEYFRVRSKSYFHSSTPVSYDPDNILPYYIDHAERAIYPGPVDSAGIPLYNHRGTVDYQPVGIALTAFGNLDMYRRTGDETYRMRFIQLCDWFVAKQDNNGMWLINLFDRQYGLMKPWPSALTQGKAISCLVRAYALTNDMRYLVSARAGLKSFHIEIQDGGVVRTNDGLSWYEEYPSAVPYQVLNGFIFALWGLYDLVRIEENALARELYEAGLQALRKKLPEFDTGYWSLYHISFEMTNPASVPYHRLHIAQVHAMYRITGDEIFERYAAQWEEYLNGRFNALRTLPAKLRWRMAHWM
ncbi:MAG: D-glucuronyl C5-epimerase family protein [candidate division Zixibacteria bacterium]|nr:D-glucuronyl C5-epimerase family protein [candidate division Zixibacteria bacterium]